MNRQRIKADLSAKFKHASGRSVMEHGVDQWDALMEALLDAMLEMIRNEMQTDSVELRRD